MANSFSVDLSSARRLHVIDAQPWISSGSAFWLEWNHPLEQSRTLEDIVQGLVNNNWHRLIPAGSTCLDVGAHTGDTAIPMGLFAYHKSRNQKGKVVVVEPNPDLADVLAACLSLNVHVADFYFENVAVTSSDMLEVELHDHGNSNCNGGLIGAYSDTLKERLHSLSGKTYKTCGRSMSNIVKSYARVGCPNDIRFIKTDCEGYDKEIIRSSKDYLMQAKPALYVEWFAMFSPEDDSDFIQAFSEIDYELFDPITLKQLTSENRPFDVVAVPKGRLSDYLAW